MRAISTAFEVRVRGEDARQQTTQDVIFVLNPFELGIETVALWCFDMEDEDYIFFGDVWEAGERPLRSPVMLLDCAFVEEA